MKDISKIKREKRETRHKRVRAKIKGTYQRPRLSVFRSNQYVWAQLIDDATGKTILAVSSRQEKKKKGVKKIDESKETGKEMAKKAIEKGIKQVVFDRGGYKYHGRVKAFAEGAREGGLEF